MRMRPAISRIVVSSVMAAGCAASLAVEYPGTLVYDSVVQLGEGRAGRYGFWHPPAMSWLLGLSDRLMPGAAVYMTMQTLVGFGALLLLMLVPKRTSWTAVVAAAVFAFLPQLFLYQGVVVKDVLFADAMLAGFAALAAAAAWWRMRRLRWTLLAVSAAFLALAALARQNGVLLLPFAALALAAIAVKNGAANRKGAWLGVAFLAVAGVGVFAATAALSLRHDGTPATETQFKILRVYDIAGMLARHPAYRLTVLDAHAPALAAAIRSDGVRLYSPAKNDTLEGSARLTAARNATSQGVVAAEWRALVAAHPFAWLAQRGEVFAWAFLPTHIAECHPFYVGVQADAENLAALGLKTRFDSRDVALLHYGYVMMPTPAFWHPLYGAVALAALFFLLVRRRPEDLAMAGLLAGALVFAASFFLISIACDYRYLYALDLAAIAAALYVLADPSLKKSPQNRSA
jgi:hypothetical protein